MGLEDMILDKIDLNGNKIPDRKELAPLFAKLPQAVFACAEVVDMAVAKPALDGMGGALAVLESKVPLKALEDGKLSLSDIPNVLQDQEVQKSLLDFVLFAARLKSAIDKDNFENALKVLGEIKVDLEKFAAPLAEKNKKAKK